jgi:outer membrane protein TolC
VSDTNTSIGVEYDTSYVGIQINVPIFSGGGVSAQTRQALAREEKVRQSLESARRKTLAEANKLYQTLQQGNELVHALNQAVLSGEQAVLAEKKGVQAGTRTFVDALDAERRLYESMRDHATAIYSLANTRLKFLALAGAIDFEAIETLNSWLTSARH